jgi:hypothetical protein
LLTGVDSRGRGNTGEKAGEERGARKVSRLTAPQTTQSVLLFWLIKVHESQRQPEESLLLSLASFLLPGFSCLSCLSCLLSVACGEGRGAEHAAHVGDDDKLTSVHLREKLEIKEQISEETRASIMYEYRGHLVAERRGESRSRQEESIKKKNREKRAKKRRNKGVESSRD